MALLACAPRELHTLALIGFGIALHHRGWRTTDLGADTPITSLRDTAVRVGPSLVVVSAATSARFAHVEDDLRARASDPSRSPAPAPAGRWPTRRRAVPRSDPLSAAALVATTGS